MWKVNKNLIGIKINKIVYIFRTYIYPNSIHSIDEISTQWGNVAKDGIGFKYIEFVLVKVDLLYCSFKKLPASKQKYCDKI